MPINVNDKAIDFEVFDFNGKKQQLLGHGHPVLLSFFRHAGCPMCNLRTRELILAHDKMQQYGLKVMAVFESPAKSIKRDVGRQNPPFPLIPDPQRLLYKLYGVTISWLGFVKIFAVRPKHVYQAIFKNSFIPKFAEATPMMPADFLIDPNGTVRIAYYGTDIGDHLPLDDLYTALDNIKTSVDIKPEVV